MMTFSTIDLYFRDTELIGMSQTVFYDDNTYTTKWLMGTDNVLCSYTHNVTYKMESGKPARVWAYHSIGWVNGTSIHKGVFIDYAGRNGYPVQKVTHLSTGKKRIRIVEKF